MRKRRPQAASLTGMCGQWEEEAGSASEVRIFCLARKVNALPYCSLVVKAGGTVDKWRKGQSRLSVGLSLVMSAKLKERLPESRQRHCGRRQPRI